VQTRFRVKNTCNGCIKYMSFQFVLNWYMKKHKEYMNLWSSHIFLIVAPKFVNGKWVLL